MLDCFPDSSNGHFFTNLNLRSPFSAHQRITKVTGKTRDKFLNDVYERLYLAKDLIPLGDVDRITIKWLGGERGCIWKEHENWEFILHVEA